MLCYVSTVYFIVAFRRTEHVAWSFVLALFNDGTYISERQEEMNIGFIRKLKGDEIRGMLIMFCPESLSPRLPRKITKIVLCGTIILSVFICVCVFVRLCHSH